MVPLNTFRRHQSLHFYLLWPQVHTQIHTRMGLHQWVFWPSKDCSQAPQRALDTVLFLLGIKMNAFWWAKQLNWVNIQFVDKLVLACQLDHGCLPRISPILDYFVPSKMRDPKISFAVGSFSYVRRELGIHRSPCQSLGCFALRMSWEPLA